MSGKRSLTTTWLKALQLWLASPQLIWNRDPVRYYEYLGDDVIEGEHDRFRDPARPLWLNLGYWEHAKTYPEAAAALARLVAEHAALSSRDRLLDVGFGFAEQDFLWLRELNVAQITGVNITPMQVQRARQRAREHGVFDRIDLMVGSATALPFRSQCFDKVTALECSHHFDTREAFFAEAFRVLRPGGRLVLADGVPLPGFAAPGFLVKLVLKRWAYVLANFYDRDVYTRKLMAAGFTNVRAHSIREHVFAQIARYGELRREGSTIHDTVVELSDADRDRGLAIWDALGVNDYVIFSADKP